MKTTTQTMSDRRRCVANLATRRGGPNAWRHADRSPEFPDKHYISHTFALSEAPRVFADMAARKVWYNKVVFVISEEARKEQRSGL